MPKRKAPRSYIDIGHGDPQAVLWIYYDDRIQTARSTSGTHEEILGFDVSMNHWRGRFEPKTGLLSVVRPGGPLSPYAPIPRFLIDLLEARFGGDITAFGFNPQHEFAKV